MIDPKFLHGVIPQTHSRFTEKQLAVYEKYGQATRIRTGCLSGVCIAMKTDSRDLEVELALKGRARNYLGLELEVDGTIVKSIRIKDLMPEMEKFKIKIFRFPDKKERKIKLHLPVSVEIEVISCSADGEPTEKQEKKILFLGDSITQGMDCISPVCAYPCVVAKIFNADFINQGVGGFVFDAESLDRNFPFEPDIITVAYGVNDWNKDFSAQKIAKSAYAYLEKLKKIFAKSKIFVITPIWTERENQKKKAGLLQNVRKIIEDAGKKTGCNVIDGLSLVPHDSFYFVDGIHPNETGHLMYGINLATHLKKI
ncbi:MAG: SGNH/GDSL hydrolase family protein [Candidatus Omnitrophica bacterium]|nr:SGNH/GDSL hydrolase family protein [Candidatus Omnitrophota bacterium]MCM8824612.1 SGNH/GDSL hydrolase family protein [Candidatus Omnitrophota bacterium]